MTETVDFGSAHTFCEKQNTQPTDGGWLCVFTYVIVRTDVLEPGSSNQGLSFILLIASNAPIQADRAAGSNLPTCHANGVKRKGFTYPCASC